jgi:hypothetical protein
MRHSLIALTLVATACSNDSTSASDAATGSQTVVNGNLGGAAFTARDAVWKNVTVAGFPFDGMSTVIEVTDFANDCSLQTTQTGTPNGRIFVLALAATDASGNSSPITATGTYSVFTGTVPTSAKAAVAYFEIDDAACLKSSFAFALSGTVTVTSATDPQQATFDVTFPDNEHVTGSYNAASCAGLNPNATPLGGC